jgi:hypothetical protein
MLDYWNKYISYFVIILSVLGQQSWYKIYTLDLQTSIKAHRNTKKKHNFQSMNGTGALKGKAQGYRERERTQDLL